VSAPFSLVEPVFDTLRIQDFRQAIGFVACVVPFASSQNDAYVIVFPRINRVREIFIWTVEVDVVVVIAVEKRADVE
jgi:hypothetical protein